MITERADRTFLETTDYSDKVISGRQYRPGICQVPEKVFESVSLPIDWQRWKQADYNREFSNYLIYLRQLHGVLSQSSFAKILGLDKSRISRLESGKENTPCLETVSRIADAAEFNYWEEFNLVMRSGRISNVTLQDIFDGKLDYRESYLAYRGL